LQRSGQGYEPRTVPGVELALAGLGCHKDSNMDGSGDDIDRVTVFSVSLVALAGSTGRQPPDGTGQGEVKSGMGAFGPALPSLSFAVQ
jgi:hypothetical protein